MLNGRVRNNLLQWSASKVSLALRTSLTVRVFQEILVNARFTEGVQTLVYRMGITEKACAENAR